MTSPSPELIKRARQLAGLSARQAAELIYCKTNAWQKWEASERAMHSAFWELFCIKAQLNCSRCHYPFGDDWLDDGETCPHCKLVQ